jgi:hypothetical protein
MPSWKELLEEVRAVGCTHDVIRRKYLYQLHKKTGRNVYRVLGVASIPSLLPMPTARWPRRQLRCNWNGDFRDGLAEENVGTKHVRKWSWCSRERGTVGSGRKPNGGFCGARCDANYHAPAHAEKANLLRTGIPLSNEF